MPLPLYQVDAFTDRPFSGEAVVPTELREGLGVALRYVARGRFDYLAVVDGEETVRDMKPDLPLLAQLPVRGISVTSRAASSDYDFVSRFFGPGTGVDEDPVTGSAHCLLGPYWGEKLGKTEMVGYQASSRGGMVRIRLQGDRVILGGQAVTILRGELLE